MIYIDNVHIRGMATTLSQTTMHLWGNVTVSTCEDVVDLPHCQVSVLHRETHGGFKFEHIAMRSVSTKKDVLFLQPGTK